jgi:hypothetical protein
VNAASLRCSFSSPARTFSYSSVETGYTPLNTMGRISLKPGRVSVAPSREEVTVSPMRMSAGSLMVPTR